MLGMNFTSFLTLLVVSVVVAAVYHWILRYRFLEGIDSFLSPQRVVLEGVCKALRCWIGCRRGNPAQAGSIEQPRVLRKGGTNATSTVLLRLLRSQRSHTNTQRIQKGSVGTLVWNAPDSSTPRIGTVSYSEA
jgi:hypothetical protein